MPLPPLTSRQWLLATAGLCLLGVLAALGAQYGLDMQPCPYCILQRVMFVIIIVLCLIGAFLPDGLRRVFAGVASVFGVLIAAAAVYQHFVAAKSQSCNLTLADKIINAFNLEALWPAVFTVRGSCADAAVSLLGVPFEFWSLGLAAVVAGVAWRVVVRA